jgi:hypothetical protein
LPPPPARAGFSLQFVVSFSFLFSFLPFIIVMCALFYHVSGPRKQIFGFYFVVFRHYVVVGLLFPARYKYSFSALFEIVSCPFGCACCGDEMIVMHSLVEVDGFK